MTDRKTCDVLVLGSGIAGLSYALKASRYGRVLLLTKKTSTESNTNHAQGGVASVTDPADSFELHIRDTMVAGAGLCRRDAVDRVVREGPELVRELVKLGADFTRTETGGFSLGREGGHTRRRIVHAKDLTGREIERALLAAIASRENIEILENHFALDLWTGPDASGQSRCHGALYLDCQSGRVGLAHARQTMLATGGGGKVYTFTTNPDIATADGVAMGARAGCEVVNMEFVQFHPTCLFHPDEKTFLISEAVRGEGAVLRDQAGMELMAGRHELGSLAPRDVVAREMDRAMKRRGDKFVLLDVSSIGNELFVERFPGISERLSLHGIVPGVDPIPVVPAAHYMCGGLPVDEFGRTSVAGLFAAGEVACSGVHGANRLASNSLLEALVYANRAAQVPPEAEVGPPPPPPAGPGTAAPRPDQGVVLDHEWDSVRRLMWDFVGLARTRASLDVACARLSIRLKEAEARYRKWEPNTDLAELRNITLVGRLLAEAARGRRESRGLHWVLDHPETDDTACESWVRPEAEGVKVEFRAVEGAGSS
ncbi:MAG: L-aspartate oxidase [Gemmatimonadota bacterium]|nr:L-aspartate oxidase [Gemmatimonadota bacterium]